MFVGQVFLLYHTQLNSIQTNLTNKFSWILDSTSKKWQQLCRAKQFKRNLIYIKL